MVLTPSPPGIPLRGSILKISSTECLAKSDIVIFCFDLPASHVASQKVKKIIVQHCTMVFHHFFAISPKVGFIAFLCGLNYFWQHNIWFYDHFLTSVTTITIQLRSLVLNLLRFGVWQKLKLYEFNWDIFISFIGGYFC